MSVYSQSTHFSSHPYPPAPPMHYGYYNQPPPPPPPPPVYHVDPNTFRRDYASRLGELTVNSRPIIQSLSMIAQECSRFADIVAQCIEAHIRRVPPWMKLPAFYLLDAISKNVHVPYAAEFSVFVVPLFLETYDAVDQPTRSKMEEMLLTWRTGSPTGKELFGVATQLAIERGIWGGGGSAYNTSSHYPGNGHVTRNQVISELEFAAGQKERALQARPYDTVIRNHLTVLHQLRSLVESGVSQEELQQILNQLRVLLRSSAPPPPPPAPAPVAAPPAPSQMQPDFWSPAPSYNQPQPLPVLHPSQPASHYNTNPTIKSELHEPANVDVSLPQPAAPFHDIAYLLSNLVKAGVVSSSGTPVGAGSSEGSSESLDVDRVDTRAYRKLILGNDVKLSSSDIVKQRPQIVSVLYDSLPSQCRQCSLRFSDTAAGKKKLEQHLDMHFRQNRQASNQTGRGYNRSWMVGVEDWAQDTFDAKGKGRADGRKVTVKAAAAAESAKRDSELRAMFVVVPPGDEAKAMSCPICKEALKSEFLEDDEEWVWKNAILKDDRVYHATCHAEASTASTNTLASRLRSDMSGRSRSCTPDVRSGSKSPLSSTKALSVPKQEIGGKVTDTSDITSVSGMKRKAENDDSNHFPVTPPLKKQAILRTN